MASTSIVSGSCSSGVRVGSSADGLGGFIEAHSVWTCVIETSACFGRVKVVFNRRENL
jgi:hypothetical protein